MFRKLILASVAAVGLATPFAFTSNAQAGGFKVHVHGGYGSYRGGWYSGYSYPRRAVTYYQPVIRHYCVVYRTCDHDAWMTYATYSSHSFAHEVVDRLQFDGYQAKVVHH